MFCGSCGAKNPDDAKFCYSCGKPLNSPPQVKTTPPPPPPVDNTQLYLEAARDFAAEKNTDAVSTVRAHVRNELRAGKTVESMKQDLTGKGFNPLHADLLVTRERAQLDASNAQEKKAQRRQAGGGALMGGFFFVLVGYNTVSNLNQKGFQWNFQDWSQWLPGIMFLGGLIAIVRGIYLLLTSG